MDNQLSEIEQKQKERLDEAVEIGSIFEDMVRHKGWTMVLSNYQNELRTFINDLMLKDKPIAEYELKRQELKGVQKLITRIDNAIKVAQDERKKESK